MAISEHQNEVSSSDDLSANVVKMKEGVENKRCAIIKVNPADEESEGSDGFSMDQPEGSITQTRGSEETARMKVPIPSTYAPKVPSSKPKEMAAVKPRERRLPQYQRGFRGPSRGRSKTRVNIEVLSLKPKY